MHTLLAWAQRHGIQPEFIRLGKPQQNACVKRHNRAVRYDWLSQSLFDTPAALQAVGTAWLWGELRRQWNLLLLPSSTAGAR